LDDIWNTRSKLSGAGLTDFGHDLRSSESWRARRIFVFFWSGKQRTILPISRQPNFTSPNLNIIRRSVYSESFRNRILKKNPARGRLSKKRKKFAFFQRLATSSRYNSAMIKIDGNSLQNYPSTGCLVSIFTVGINSKSFPWPVHSIQETTPKFSATLDTG